MGFFLNVDAAFLAATRALFCILSSALAMPVVADPKPCDPPTILGKFPIEHAIGAKWNNATARLAYGKPAVDGTYAAFISANDGSQEHRIAFAGWRDNQHQFPVAWHPSGRYLVLSVEKPQHPGHHVDATPGYGGYSDYWLMTMDDQTASKLVELPNDRDHAITHAAFSPDGTRFTWTERIKAPKLTSLNLFAGSYRFNVANFVLSESPHLINVRSFIPTGAEQGGEVESMASDNRTIAFYSTLRTKNLFASRIYTLDTESGALAELTTESWSQAPTFTPDGSHIIYMSGAEADIFPWSLQGADWWIMRRDGSHKQRLTYMNQRGNPQSAGHFRLAGSLSFISASRYLGDVMTKSLGLVGEIADVTLRTGCVDAEE